MIHTPRQLPRERLSGCGRLYRFSEMPSAGWHCQEILDSAAIRTPHLPDSSTLAYYVSRMANQENPQAALELLILKTLAAGPNHGFGIALHIEEASSALLRVEEGSLYPALHRLDKAGFIDAEWTTTRNGRRARVYRLTKEGRKRLKEIEESWTTLAEGVKRVLRWA